MRPLVGHEPHRLLLPSALGGALLVVAADTAVRALHTTPELMIGVVTSLIGAPFFLHLIFTTRRSMR
jgi:iron complex transport system permease protein